MNTKKETIKLGTIAVDSGKLMLCDPSYLTEWENDKATGMRRYRDTETDKLYVYKTDFENYSDVLIDDLTVKQLIESGRLEAVEEPTEQSFSNSSLHQQLKEKGFANFNFTEGHAGMALTFLAGDGEFPVYADMENGELRRIWIDFFVEN